MRRFNRYIARYLLLAFPAVLAILTWGMFQSQQEVTLMHNGILKALREALSWHLILWFCMLVYFLAALLVSARLRDDILAKIARVRERDEREKQITGNASRFAFFSTLAMLIFLLFLNTVNVNMERLDPAQSFDGKTMRLSLGFSFGKLEINPPADPQKGVSILSVHKFPFSAESMILFLIVWHMGGFIAISRKGFSRTE